MIRNRFIIGLVVCALFVAVCPASAESVVWTCPECGQTDLQSNYCFKCGVPRPVQTVCGCGYALPDDSGYLYCPECGAWLVGYESDDESDDLDDWEEPFIDPDPDAPYDIGIPYLNGTVIREDQMNLIVLWVQTQLKATGVYYQGEEWDVTGYLGAQTVTEIKSFMRARGYGGHGGQIDQTVIDQLAAYLGDRVVPVYAGGYYDRMSVIMIGGSAGGMERIVSNLRDMVPRVTVGARWVQCCLSKLGYYNGVIDGKYGEGTETAVKLFQSNFGFQMRDYVTLGVARAMLEECRYRGFPLDDLP